MIDIHDPKLIAITDAANARLQTIHTAFGWGEVWMQIHPGIVAVVLEAAAEHQPPTAHTTATTSETPKETPVPKSPLVEEPAPVAPTIPSGSAEEIPAPSIGAEDATAPSGDEPDRPVSAREANAELIERAKTVIREIAVNGQMPTMAAFNAARPAGLPRAQYILQKTYVRWGDIARQCDLEMTKGRRRGATKKPPQTAHRKPPTTAKPAPATHRAPIKRPAPSTTQPETTTRDELAAHTDADARRRLLEDIIFHLRYMAVDGKLPAKETWDARKPAELPDAATIIMRWGLINWDDIAGFAKLSPNSSRKRNVTINPKYLEVD